MSSFDGTNCTTNNRFYKHFDVQLIISFRFYRIQMRAFIPFCQVEWNYHWLVGWLIHPSIPSIVLIWHRAISPLRLFVGWSWFEVLGLVSKGRAALNRLLRCRCCCSKQCPLRQKWTAGNCAHKNWFIHGMEPMGSINFGSLFTLIFFKVC